MYNLGCLGVVSIIAMKLVIAADQCTERQFKSPFYLHESCEAIYSSNPESHSLPGYYWITHEGPNKVYCGMICTGSSCEDIYNNYPETGKKPGLYQINTDQCAYFIVLVTMSAGVEGVWKKIANINIGAGDNCPTGWS